MVLLLSSDNEQFRTEPEIIERSGFIKCFLDGSGETDEPIPLPNVSSNVLRKILEYCEHHRGEPLPNVGLEPAQPGTHKQTDDISEWDQEFIAVDKDMLFEIISAANYLDIPSLLDVGCKTVANMIKGKNPQEINELFNIRNSLTPEREV